MKSENKSGTNGSRCLHGLVMCVRDYDGHDWHILDDQHNTAHRRYMGTACHPLFFLAGPVKYREPTCEKCTAHNMEESNDD